MVSPASRRQIKYFCVLIAICFTVLIISLFLLQIVHGSDYRQQAQALQVRTLTSKGARGRITDRYGTELAGNRISYQVMFFPSEAEKEQWNTSLAAALTLMRSAGIECEYPLPIELHESGFVYNQSSEEIAAFLSQHKLPENTSAADAVQALMDKYEAGDVPGEIALDLLGLRSQLSLQSYRSYLPICLGESEDFSLCARIMEYKQPGIRIQTHYTRSYPQGETLCHVLGSVGKIPADEADAYQEQGYDISSDIVGKSGLEQTLESLLRTKKGQTQLSVNSLGLSTSSNDINLAEDGETVVLTIDLTLQQAAEKALRQTMADIRAGKLGEAYPNAEIGAAVCIDVHTGEVLALASEPGYDPNVFTETLPDAVWQALSPSYVTASGKVNSDPTLPRPLVNNAVSAAFPPGSVFKPITAAAALGADKVTAEETILDLGRYTAFSETEAPGCWTWNESHTTHGYVDLHDALEGSCNYYFYEVGVRTGSEQLEATAEKFGLGQQTGIGLSGEASGMVDGQKTATRLVNQRVAAQLKSMGYTVDEETLSQTLAPILSAPSLQKAREQFTPLGIHPDDIPALYQTINDNRWRESRVLAAAIGQGADSVTPLQMANAIAALTQAGRRYQPQLVLSLPDSQGRQSSKIVCEPFMETQDVQDILNGMRAVTQPGGTAAKYFSDCTVSVAGKTGTAQSEGRDAYAWFVAAAPAENPSIAIAVVIGQGGHGSYAAPVAKAIIEAYFASGTGSDLAKEKSMLR